MVRINKSSEKENVVPTTMQTPTLADVRAKAKELRHQLSQDKFVAAAFKASPKAILKQCNHGLVDVRQVPLCAECRTTCGYTCKVTNICGRTQR